LNNRTDVFAAPAVSATGAALTLAQHESATSVQATPAEWRSNVSANIAFALKSRQHRATSGASEP